MRPIVFILAGLEVSLSPPLVPNPLVRIQQGKTSRKGIRKNDGDQQVVEGFCPRLSSLHFPAEGSTRLAG